MMWVKSIQSLGLTRTYISEIHFLQESTSSFTGPPLLFAKWFAFVGLMMGFVGEAIPSQSNHFLTFRVYFPYKIIEVTKSFLECILLLLHRRKSQENRGKSKKIERNEVKCGQNLIINWRKRQNKYFFLTTKSQFLSINMRKHFSEIDFLTISQCEKTFSINWFLSQFHNLFS